MELFQVSAGLPDGPEGISSVIVDYLDEWNAGAVEVHHAEIRLIEGIRRVYQFSRVLLQVNPADADRIGPAVVAFDFEVSVFTKRPLELGDLISFGNIRIKVILAGEPGDGVYVTVEGQSGPHAELHRSTVQDRKGAGVTGADRAYI